MTPIILDLPCIALCEHLLLIFLLVREARRKIYPFIASNAKLAFPEIARFFDMMEKDHEKLYPVVDRAKAATGRPPLCHHFQFRFLVFYFLSSFYRQTLISLLHWILLSKHSSDGLLMPSSFSPWSDLSFFGSDTHKFKHIFQIFV